MSARCGLIKLKPGSLDKVSKWAETMNARKDEALQTLVSEGVTIETVFLVKIDNDDYLIYYMKSDDFEKAQEVVKNSLMEIDAIHRQFKKDCWSDITHSKCLLDLEVK